MIWQRPLPRIAVAAAFAHGVALLLVLHFENGWRTDFLISFSPTLALCLTALSLWPSRHAGILMMLELAYGVISTAILVLALPGSENDDGRQIALMVVPIVGFAAVAYAVWAMLPRD